MHLSGMAGFEPLGKVREFGKTSHRRTTGDIETGVTGRGLHQFGQFKRWTVVPHRVVIGHDLEPSTAVLENDRHWRIFA